MMANDKIKEILRAMRTHVGWRFQACDFVEEGGEGYKEAGDVAVSATKYLRETEKYIDMIEEEISKRETSTEKD